MTVTIGGDDYTLPDSLADMTLQQQMDWSAKIGGFLMQEQKRLNAAKKLLPDVQLLPPENIDTRLQAQIDAIELERIILITDTAHHSLCFWGNIPDDIEAQLSQADRLNLYAITEIILAAEQRDIIPEDSYEFSGTTWVIAPPYAAIAPADYSKVQFDALMTLAKAFYMMAEHDWASAPQIMAAYLRQEGEDFDESWLVPGNARYDLMLTLPLNIALAVLTYVTDSMTLYLANVSNYIETSLQAVIGDPVPDPDVTDAP